MGRIMRDPAMQVAMGALGVSLALVIAGLTLRQSGHSGPGIAIIVVGGVLGLFSVLAVLASFSGDESKPRVRLELVRDPKFCWSPTGNTRYYVATVRNRSEVTALGCWPQIEFDRRWQKSIDMPPRVGAWEDDIRFDGSPYPGQRRDVLPGDATQRVVVAFLTEGMIMQGGGFILPTGQRPGNPPQSTLIIGGSLVTFSMRLV